MKRFSTLTLTLSLVFALGILFSSSVFAQTKGTGTPKGHGQFFVDQNGDGICDNLGTHQGQKAGNLKKGNGVGAQDGTGFKGNGKGTGVCNGTGSGVCNGTGTGSGSGTGVCDGTGPKGNSFRGGKK